MKSAILLCFFVFCATLSDAQKSVLFKIKLLPSHNYATEINTGVNMEMNLFGTAEQMKTLEAKGIKMPMLMKSASNNTINIVTSKLSEGGFSFVFKYLDMSSTKSINGEEHVSKNPLSGHSLYGHVTQDDIRTIDSIPGKDLNDTLKAGVTAIVNAVQDLVKFPESPMKAGDSFTQYVPLTIPLGPVNMQMTIKVTYNLKSIKDNLANFDIDESLIFSMDITKGGVELKGTGKGNGVGKLIYSIKDNYPLDMSSTLNFNLSLDAPDMKMGAKATTTSSHKTIIISL